ncbi:EspB family ESX-1 secretion system-associated protein [Mycobacterium sp. ML4]
MTQTMSVEYQELMARADELEQPIPPVPSGNPQSPCRLAFVDDTAVQLALSADSMRLYLQACEREWRRLATSLRNAAKAYETVDEGSAAAISSVKFDGSGATSGSGTGNQMSAMSNPAEDLGVPATASSAPQKFEDPYYEVREAATLIETGDQGNAYKAFAEDWYAFQRAFQAETYRFRPFTYWEGASQQAVEANFDAQRQWIYSMSALCVDLGQQAVRVVDAHKKARIYGTTGVGPTNPAEHPTSYEVSLCDYWYAEYTRTKSPYLYMAIEWYEELQTQSESSLQLYVANAGVPLRPVVPTSPPKAYPIAPPAPPKPDPGPDNPDSPENPREGITSPDDPYGDYPTDASLPAANMMPPTGMTGMPTMPSSQNDPKLTEALNRLGNAPGGVRPAGVGGAGGGMPKAPLGEAGAQGVAAAGAAAGNAAVGGAIPGARGAGGAMGGGMPMGGAPGGQGKDGKQGKRISSEEEALYTEDREWTGGVIGRRRAKDTPDDQ